MKRHPFALLVCIFSFALASCNLGAPAPQDPAAVATSAALTVEAVLSTPAASPTASQVDVTPTHGILANPSEVSAFTTQTAAAGCTENPAIVSWSRDGLPYDAKEVEKRLAPEKGFVLSWVIKNTGTCVWDDQYVFRFESGERLTQADTFPIMPKGYHIDPGVELTINIQMQAPAKPGDYESGFSLVDPQGKNILNVGVLTKVGTNSNAAIKAPGDLRYSYDCTSGVVSISLSWSDKADNEDGYRIYRDGEKLTDLPAGTTSYDDIVPSTGSYAYTVAAFNASGESPSKVVAETTNCQ